MILALFFSHGSSHPFPSSRFFNRILFTNELIAFHPVVPHQNKNAIVLLLDVASVSVPVACHVSVPCLQSTQQLTPGHAPHPPYAHIHIVLFGTCPEHPGSPRAMVLFKTNIRSALGPEQSICHTVNNSRYYSYFSQFSKVLIVVVYENYMSQQETHLSCPAQLYHRLLLCCTGKS